MSRAPVLIGLICATVFALGLRATAQVTLPDGPNRELVARACGSCHDLGMVVSAARTREGWDGTIDDMISYGMSITAADRRLVLEYLARYLPPPSR
jgi:hypothetical protein